jgi:hypothetical protein
MAMAPHSPPARPVAATSVVRAAVVVSVDLGGVALDAEPRAPVREGDVAPDMLRVLPAPLGGALPGHLPDDLAVDLVAAGTVLALEGTPLRGLGTLPVEMPGYPPPAHLSAP